MREANRAIRRHHVERLKKNRSHYWGREELTKKQLGKVVTHPAACCGCFGCGNPRRYTMFSDLPKGVTVQEFKQQYFFRSSYSDLFELDFNQKEVQDEDAEING